MAGLFRNRKWDNNAKVFPFGERAVKDFTNIPWLGQERDFTVHFTGEAIINSKKKAFRN